MSVQTCVDALIYWNGSPLSTTNDVTIHAERDMFETHPYVSDEAAAFFVKQPLWIKWSASIKAYYDDTDNTVQNSIQDGDIHAFVIYPTRDLKEGFWYGNAVAKNLEHSINPNVYSELSFSL